VGGSADPASSTVVIAACTQLAPANPVTPGTTSSPTPLSTPSSALTAPGTPASGSASATPGASPSPSRPAGQGCLHPELVALSL